MKLDEVKRRVSVSGVQQHNAFFIKGDAKTFDLMMANLYSNPIKAFIRELSTNAYEAHQMIGIEDKPFKVTLPDYNSYNFVIRDYGPGLSEEDVKFIYVGVGVSTKDNTDDLGGCFGLGSKSPFAYVGNTPFSVTSYYNGNKYSYVCYRDEEGIPCMDLLSKDATIEPTGVEVSVPVKRNDVYSVIDGATQVYRWFDVKPTLNVKLTYDNIANDEHVIFSGRDYKIYNCDINLIKMGNIVYPLDLYQSKLKKFATGILIEMPIGSVTVIPSREALRYNGKTISALSDKLEEIEKEIAAKVSKDISVANSYYEACLMASNAVSGYPGLRIGSLQFKGVQLTCGYKGILNGKVMYIGDSKARRADFSYSREFKFFNADSVAHMTRIKNHLRGKCSMIVICHEGKQKELADEIGINESDIVNTSTLLYTPPLKGTKRVGNGHKTRVLQYTDGKSRTLTKIWTDCSVDLAINHKNCYYVEYYANQVMVNGECYHPSIIDMMAKDMGLKNVVVYGIKTELLNRVKDNIQIPSLYDEYENFIKTNLPKLQEEYSHKLTADLIVAKFIRLLELANNNVKLKTSKDIQNLIDTYDLYVKDSNHISAVMKTLTQLRLISKLTDGVTPNNKIKRYYDSLVKLIKLFSIYQHYDDDDCKEFGYYFLGKGL